MSFHTLVDGAYSPDPAPLLSRRMPDRTTSMDSPANDLSTRPSDPSHSSTTAVSLPSNAGRTTRSHHSRVRIPPVARHWSSEARAMGITSFQTLSTWPSRTIPPLFTHRPSAFLSRRMPGRTPWSKRVRIPPVTRVESLVLSFQCSSTSPFRVGCECRRDYMPPQNRQVGGSHPPWPVRGSTA